MTRKDQKHVARRQMDSRVEPFRTMKWIESPRSGWIRAIRDGLGMTGAQLAKRLGIKQPTVVEFERNEVERRITLETLDRAAKAMGCRLVYALVPEQSLESTVQSRARALARKRFAHLGQPCAWKIRQWRKRPKPGTWSAWPSSWPPMLLQASGTTMTPFQVSFQADESATPLSPDECNGLLPQHITLRQELNELEA